MVVEDEEDFTLFAKTEMDIAHMASTSNDEFDKACMTKVWYVWDRVTRRLEMYADNDWKWPIWVWDDPYQLQGFYPLTPLMVP